MRIALTTLAFLLISAFAALGKQYYVLQGIDKTQPDSVLTEPVLEGFTIRVSWQKIHDEGFTWLDEQIARGDQHDVDIHLRLMAGRWAPANLSGVSYFEYTTIDEQGSPKLWRAPVPWDIEMHQQWQAIANQVASRYAGNSRIKVVHIPGFANSSEMHMPDEIALLPDYTSRDLAASWFAMAEPLVSGFPNAIVSLNYATPQQSLISGEDSQWLRDQLDTLAGSRVGYQANDLSAKVTLERNKYETIVERRELGSPVGFQLLSPSAASRFGGEFGDAIATGLEAGAEWFEIYPDDIDAIATHGDYNGNGIVDAADYVVWRKAYVRPGGSLHADGNRNGSIDGGDYVVWWNEFSQAAITVPAAAGDYNNSGAIDAADYVVWRKRLGTAYAPQDYSVWRARFAATPGGGAAATAVPESASVALIVITVVPTLSTAARRCRPRRSQGDHVPKMRQQVNARADFNVERCKQNAAFRAMTTKVDPLN